MGRYLDLARRALAGHDAAVLEASPGAEAAPYPFVTEQGAGERRRVEAPATAPPNEPSVEAHQLDVVDPAGLGPEEHYYSAASGSTVAAAEPDDLREVRSLWPTGTPPALLPVAVVPPGWEPLRWGNRLRRLAAFCDHLHPGEAERLAAWAGVVERRAVGLPDVLVNLPAADRSDLVEQFEERAAIAESDGRLPRIDALKIALAEVQQAIQIALPELGVPRAADEKNMSDAH